jgi:hypothetical protein
MERPAGPILMSGYRTDEKRTWENPQCKMHKRGNPEGKAHGGLLVERLPPHPGGRKYQQNSSTNKGAFVDIGKRLIDNPNPEKPGEDEKCAPDE